MAKKKDLKKRLTIDKLNNDGVVNLLEAILSSLYDDFVSAYNAYHENPAEKKNYLSFLHIKEIICSKYIADLTGISGFEIVEQLEAKCNKEFLKRKVA